MVALTFQYQSTSGFLFSVNPSLTGDIENLTTQVRAEIAAARNQGKLVCYMSVPLSSKSGGDFATNTNMAAQIAVNIVNVFGPKLWVLNPAAYNLPAAAQGGDYMAVWSDVLGGVDGSGADFDAVYFVGPSDVWRYFGVGAADRLGTIEAWLAAKAAASAAYKQIYDNPTTRLGFIRYYGLRGSAIYSKGAHDEWNIAVKLNAMRAIGDELAIYFDGSPVEPGDYEARIAIGNATTLLH